MVRVTPSAYFGKGICFSWAEIMGFFGLYFFSLGSLRCGRGYGSGYSFGVFFERGFVFVGELREQLSTSRKDAVPTSPLRSTAADSRALYKTGLLRNNYAWYLI
jgi:hypothetical protein